MARRASGGSCAQHARRGADRRRSPARSGRRRSAPSRAGGQRGDEQHGARAARPPARVGVDDGPLRVPPPRRRPPKQRTLASRPFPPLQAAADPVTRRAERLCSIRGAFRCTFANKPRPLGEGSPSAAIVASIRAVTTDSLDLPLLSAGKVREMYDLGDRILMVASDRISTYDVVHPTLDPRQGRRVDRVVGVLVSPHRRDRPQPPRLDDRGRARRGPGPRPGRPQARDAPGRVRRARVPVGLGLEGLPGHRRGVRDRAAGRSARVRPAAGADLHPRDEGGDRRARREHRLRGDGPRARGSGPGRAPARRLDRPLLAARPSTPSSAASSSPTRSSSSGSTPPAR